MKRGSPANMPAVDRAVSWRAAPKRRVLLQLWLTERAWGRIVLHLWCFFLCGGKWSATRNGVARGGSDLLAKLARKLRLRRWHNGGTEQ